MGLSGISIWQLLIIFIIVVLLFGTKRLKSLGGDLGEAVRGFRKAFNEGSEETDAPSVRDGLTKNHYTEPNTIKVVSDKSRDSVSEHRERT